MFFCSYFFEVFEESPDVEHPTAVVVFPHDSIDGLEAQVNVQFFDSEAEFLIADWLLSGGVDSLKDGCEEGVIVGELRWEWLDIRHDLLGISIRE